jgi:uncharacterized membrane protein
LALLSLPIAALVIALRTSKRVRELASRLDLLELEPVTQRTASRETGDGEPVTKTPRPPAAESTAPTPGPAEPPAGERPPASTAKPSKLPSPFAPGPWTPGAAAASARSAFDARELEKRLGARLPIWLGAIALVLAAAFLVKLSFDRGWLGPAVRVALGVAFGVVLLAAGEWLRRSSARVAQGLSAAGVAVLFVSFYAAVSLYSLVPTAGGFALMALTTATAVALSLRHGPMVAVLGLVGGFLTPFLVSASEPEPKVLFTYLILLQTGLLAVSVRRGWWPLTMVSFVAGLGWVVFWLTELFQRADEPWLGLFVIVSAALFSVTGVRTTAAAAESGRQRGSELAWVAGLGGFAALATLTVRGGTDPLPWLFLGLLGAGALVLARLEPRFHQLAWVGAAIPALLLMAWAREVGGDLAGRYLWTTLLLGVLWAAGAYLAAWRSPQAGRWAWLSAAAAVAYLLLAYRGAETAGSDLPWGGICLALALLFLIAAWPLARRREESDEMESALAALAVAVTAFISLAVPIELARQWLAVAWAIEVAALVWLAGRLRIPILVRLAWVVAAAVAVRLLLNPFALRYPIGDHPLFNWLLYGYGVPLAAFAAAAWMAGDQGRRRLAAALQWASLAIGTALVTLLVRQYFHPGELDSDRFYLVEWGTVTVAWLGLVWVLLRAARRWPLASLHWFAQGLTVLALGQAALCQVLTRNPVWSHSPVGEWPVLNGLLWIYGLPALLLFLIAHRLEGRSWPLLPITCRLGSLGLVFLLITLEVRQAFHGTYLDRGTASGAEQYAYSAAWVVLGVALLTAGIASKGRLLRFASLAVMLAAVAKVFLFDLAGLRDFYRVFSFLGLGLSLLLIAWLYQRFVFRE